MSKTTCSHVQDFLASKSYCRNHTIHTYWRALKTLFYSMMQQGLRSDNPCLSIQINLDDPLPRTVSPEHLAEVIKHLDLDTFTGIRNAALFTLAFDTGARVSELLSLTVGDVLVGQRKVLIRGKGGKDRWVFSGRLASVFLKKYLLEYGKQFPIYPVYPEAPLFVTEYGGKIRSKDAVKLIWVRAQKRAGLPILPFHGLRHGFAKAWLTAGGDLFSLQQILGHSDLNVTRRYVRLLTEDLERMRQEYSPADRLWSELRRKLSPLIKQSRNRH